MRLRKQKRSEKAPWDDWHAACFVMSRVNEALASSLSELPPFKFVHPSLKFDVKVDMKKPASNRPTVHLAPRDAGFFHALIGCGDAWQQETLTRGSRFDVNTE